MPGLCILQSFHELFPYYVIPVPACAKTETYALELRALVSCFAFHFDQIQLSSQIMSIVSMLSVPSIFFRPKESSNSTASFGREG